MLRARVTVCVSRRQGPTARRSKRDAPLARAPRTFRLTSTTLAQARVSSVLALDPSVLGSLVTLPERAPVTVFPEPAAAVAPMPADENDDGEEQDSTGAHVITTPATSVAVVSIDGPLAQRAMFDLCGYVDGYDAIAARVCEAIESPAIGAVVLRISSPGGDVAGLEEAVRRMRSAADASEKTVLAFADEMAASAAYWIASGVADRVYLPESGAVGSIGCFSMLVDETKALEQEGVAVELVRDPPGKAEGHPFGPVSDLARERAQELVSGVTARFAAAVAARRGLDAKDVMKIDGAVLGGASAVKAGLADGVATLEGVIMMAGQEAAAKAAKGASLSEMAALAKVEPAAVSPELAQKTRAAAEGAMKLEASVLALTGAPDSKTALGVLAAWKASHETAEIERARYAEERRKAEAKEKTETLTKLVAKLGPAAVWALDEDGKPLGGTPSEMFASMPIEQFRGFTATLLASAAPVVPEPVKPAATGETYGLSQVELDVCKRKGIDPKAFAEFSKKKTKGASAQAGG